MELVLYPHEVEKPEEGPWVKRLKYTTVDELISDYEASNAAIGRTHCPVLDWLKAHRTDPLEHVEDKIYQHPQWGPVALCETAWKTRSFNHAASHPYGTEICAWVQHFCMHHLVKYHPFAQARAAFSDMLKEPQMEFISPEAAKIALDYLVSGHPNPGRFLAKQEVLAKFPGLDPTAYPSPDFEDAAA